MIFGVGFAAWSDRVWQRDIRTLIFAEDTARNRILVHSLRTTQIELDLRRGIGIILRIEPHRERQVKGVADIPFGTRTGDGGIIVLAKRNGVLA